MQRTIWVALLILVAVTLTRIPFLEPGFGADPDAWRVARIAQAMANGEAYQASRLPGFPVHEVSSALLWGEDGRQALFFSAIMSGVSAALFFLLLRTYGTLNSIVGALAFAFTPIVYIGGVELLDYHLALSAALAALNLSLAGSGVAAGILLGVAVGARLSSLIFLLPCLMVILNRNREHRVLTSLKVFAGLFASALFCYLPVLERYGSQFLKIYSGSFPPLPIVWEMATVRVFGELGTLSLALVAPIVIYRALIRREERVNLTALQPYLVGLLATLALYLWMPLDSGYLLPAVPFIWILLRGLLSAGVLRVLALAVILSSFVGFSDGWVGEVVRNNRTRDQQYQVITQTLSRIQELEGPVVLVVGEWGNQLNFRLGALPGTIQLRYLLKREEAVQLREQGTPVFYLPGIDEYNIAFADIDLRDYGAQALLKSIG